MHIITFLPREAAKTLQDALAGNAIRAASSWEEFDSFLSQTQSRLAFLDPEADGSMNLSTASRIIRTHPAVCFVAYVNLAPQNLAPIAFLSRNGLSEALVHPDESGVVLRNLMQRVSGQATVDDLFYLLQTRLGRLPKPLSESVRKLFQSPHRYHAAEDVAIDAGVAPKTLYRACAEAHLPTPAKLVTAAKMMRGYSYLRGRSSSIREVSRMLGYDSGRAFSERVRAIFGCQPTELRKNDNLAEVVATLLDWSYKPGPRYRRMLARGEARSCSEVLNAHGNRDGRAILNG